jgi:hypothetical protein
MQQYLFLENNKEKIEWISISGHFGLAGQQPMGQRLLPRAIGPRVSAQQRASFFL